MARRKKPEKIRRRVKQKFEAANIAWAVSARHAFGATEKIRRRNRKIWTRLTNKRRRRIDKALTVYCDSRMAQFAHTTKEEKDDTI